MAEKAYGLLINYEFCTGCGTCEIACSVEHDIPIGRYGIQMATIGPWQIDNSAHSHRRVRPVRQAR